MEFIIKHYHEVKVGSKVHETQEIEGKVIITEDGKIEIIIPRHIHFVDGMHWGFRTNEVRSMKLSNDTAKGDIVIEQNHNHYISSYDDVFTTTASKYEAKEFIIKHCHEVKIRGKIHKTQEIEGKLIITEDGKIEINIPKHTHTVYGMRWGIETNKVRDIKTNIDTEKGNIVIEQNHSHYVSSGSDVFTTTASKYEVVVCEPDKEENK